MWYIALGMLAVVAVTIYALVSVNRRPPVAPRPTQGLAPLSSGPTPKAWEFDAANNRHWDPAHGHWHNGPPPPASARP